MATKANSTTHRFFYINGVEEFGLFTDSETDPKKIFNDFIASDVFKSFKHCWGTEWDRLKLVKFDKETNTMYLESPPEDITTTDRNKKYTTKDEDKPKRKSKKNPVAAVNTNPVEVKKTSSSQAASGKKSLI